MVRLVAAALGLALVGCGDALVQSARFTPMNESNMNGEYIPGRTPSQGIANYSTNFKDYPGGVEYIEVYAGPVKTLYSQVFWAPLPEVELPAELVERFKGKGFALVGFEADQVRRTPDGDVSVPINIAYNHHYGVTMLSDGASMQYVPRDASDSRTMHASPKPGFAYVAVEHTPTASGLPTSLPFGYSNGGEFRKTYHGLAPPYAQVIESPTRISVTPMQIDTWNRDKMNISGGDAFVSGPVPRMAYAPTTGVDATYSGLLECPITTRIRKHLTGGGFNDSTSTEIYPTCPGIGKQCPTGSFGTSEDCFAAVAGLNLGNVTNAQGARDDLPPGCTVTADSSSNTATAFFNTNAASKVCCGEGISEVEGVAPTWEAGNVTLSLALSSKHMAAGNSAFGSGSMEITISGPADGNWFGVGFDTTSMSNSPYAIIVDGTIDGNVTEHVLGNHEAGIALNASVTVISNVVEDGRRTVTLQRSLKGVTPAHHSFSLEQLSMDFIAAVGSTPTLSYHRDKTASTIVMWPKATRAMNAASTAVCVCSVPALPFGKGQGLLEYLPTGETIGFPPRCNNQESILVNRNPTCDIRTYVGGLSTCHHMWSLLDADQEIPWPDQPIEYYMKWRLYFQEYDPSHHVQAFDITWSIGGATGEYDVPQCAPGTPTENCTHTITGTIEPTGTDLHFVGAHYHCHAPTCLSMEIRYENETGPLICREEPTHGQGHDLTGGDKFDESGYIAQVVCLWGSPPLEPPPLVSGKKLWVKAVTNNTYGHHGEMALPQMLLAHL